MTDDNSSSDWHTKANLDVLRQRAAVYGKIREFFKQRGVLEVDTPVLSLSTTPDPNIHSFETHYFSITEDDNNARRYLSTSPEFHMKRLLAGGSGSIYQLCHVFRQSESGSQHNPEFTMLEWYRVDWDYYELMKEVADLVTYLTGTTVETEMLSYQKVFKDHLDIDPVSASVNTLRKCAENFGLVVGDDGAEDKDLYLDFLMSQKIQPHLGNDKLTFIYEYPASQCAYARLVPDNPQVAERFELFYRGAELANGYQELLESGEQRRRFERQNEQRRLNGQPLVQWDRKLLAALQAGMPECSGVALGVDRLIQAMFDIKNIEEVLAFPFNRA